MSIADVRKHFANWREWELNPIVIKELRQAVRSWTITGMLLLFLVVLFVTSIVFLVNETIGNDADTGLGGEMFSAFMLILTGASAFFIPLYVGIRVGLERQENNPDLLYVSTLAPGRIIRGKFFSGAYMALLFFSACMPFMAFTNLLRGVDLPTVFFILAYLFLFVCAANMVAIFLACLPMSRPFKVLICLLGLLQAFGLIMPLSMFAFQFMRSGVGAMLITRDFWLSILVFTLAILMVVGLFYVLSVALISPLSANRALPVRAYITFIWIVDGFLSFGLLLHHGDADALWIWIVPTIVIMMLSLLVVISNSDHISSRVRRAIPVSGYKRALAFLFFNGAAGGLLWVAAILMATFCASRVELKFLKLTNVSDVRISWYNATIAYAFDYALTALFIHRKFLARRAAKLTGLLAVLLAGAWAIAPGIILFFLNRLTWKTIDGMQLGNVFNMFTSDDPNHLLYHTCFACGWLLVALFINAKWFLQQLQNFRPSPSSAPPVLE